MDKQKRLLRIFKLGLNSNRLELITEIIDYIALEKVTEALSLLMDFSKECETPFLKDYSLKVIKDLQSSEINVRRTIPYRVEEETTQVMERKEELILRWESALKELPKENKGK